MVVLVIVLLDHRSIGEADEDRAKIGGEGLHIV